MKRLTILTGLLLWAGFVSAQTTPPVVPFSGVAGMIITTTGNETLTDAEAGSILFAQYQSNWQTGLTQDARNAMLTAASNAVATAHHVKATDPYQIVLDVSFTLSFTPAWQTVANEGDTVTVKAGTTVRFGNAAGTSCGYAPACSTTPLAADAWQTITLTADTTFVVGSNSGPIGNDPCYGYLKVLQILSGSGSVTKPPTT